MMENTDLVVTITYDPRQLRGSLLMTGEDRGAVWERLRQGAISITDDYVLSPESISLPWPALLSLVRQFAPQQRKLNFRFKPDGAAKPKIDEFVSQYKIVQNIRKTAEVQFALTYDDIQSRLDAIGFTKRHLKDFQLRDLQQLLSLANGANFSVPGAGKTTVTFALHLLTKQPDQHLLVVAPKTAFIAWTEVVHECIEETAPEAAKEPFTILSGGREAVRTALDSGATRFVMSYDQLITVSDVIQYHLSQHPVHLVLDESHRMKGGLSVKRGAVLLNLAVLPVRRDILSGTPMPQGASDLESQLDFLWPGADLGLEIARGNPPKKILGSLYVRTTKTDLGLPPVQRHFRHVPMGQGQTALYGVVRNETLRELSSLRAGSGVDIVRARRSVMRLLQLSTNPVLALKSIVADAPQVASGLIQQVLDDGPSPKMVAVRDFARELASQGRKSVIWTIFTGTIEELERMLVDINPVVIHGAVPTGADDEVGTREGRLKRFHSDPSCMALIANPAAAGEGISLHRVCHDAIYVDRSYNATHYLQSIDRVHRLGLPPDVVTNIHIFQTLAPKGLGCIDHSVSRRLAQKVRALQQLLDDEDLHQIALDEESAEEPIDYDIEPDDLVDLIEELEGRATYTEDDIV